MKSIMLTDPFIGKSFEACKSNAGDIVIVHPLNAQLVKLAYDASSDMYAIPASALAHIETVTISQAADYMGVSVAAVLSAIKYGKLASHKLPDGSELIALNDLKRYNETKRVGRPRKVK